MSIFSFSTPNVYTNLFVNASIEFFSEYTYQTPYVQKELYGDYLNDGIHLYFSSNNKDTIKFAVEQLLQYIIDRNQDIFTKGKVWLKEIDFHQVGYVTQSTARWRKGGKAKVRNRIKKGTLPSEFIRSTLLY